jgi:20S proteasome subunit beta 1
MAVITEDGVERLFVPGDQLPKFWQGAEVLGNPGKGTESVAPMVVEA